jgi:hypothetical protein
VVAVFPAAAPAPVSSAVMPAVPAAAAAVSAAAVLPLLQVPAPGRSPGGVSYWCYQCQG